MGAPELKSHALAPRLWHSAPRGCASVIDGAPEVVYFDLTDRKVVNVSRHAAFDHHPVWAADGCTLMFTSKRSGDLDLWMVDVCAG